MTSSATSEQPAAERSGADPSRLGLKRPRWSRDFDFFLDGLQNRQFLVQRCAECGVVRHPPTPMCMTCNALEWSAEPLGPKGRVYSYIVHHHPPIPPYESPHPVALVEMDHGLRVLAAYSGDPGELRIGLPVRIEFAEVGEGFILHRFARDEAAA